MQFKNPSQMLSVCVSRELNSTPAGLPFQDVLVEFEWAALE